MDPMRIPPINATLNGLATVLLASGFVFIKRGIVAAHRRCMIAAVVVSALFLVGYITYHAMRHGHPTPFGGHGFIRKFYFVMLISHILLAFSIVFLVPRTFIFALKGDFVAHRRWARFTFPIWFYVSVTGVLVYFFLYQWFPSPPIGGN